MFSSKSVLPGLFCVTALILTCGIQVSLCNLNEFCNETVTCSVQNSFCNSSSLCQCNDTFYEKNETLCEPKKPLDQECLNSNECGTSNAECIENESQTKVCRCASGFYPKDSSCSDISSLQVTGLSEQSSTLNSVTVTWTEPADTTAVTGYTVTWSPASTTNTKSVNVTKGTATYKIPDLQSGTQYSVNVTTNISYRSQTTVTEAKTVKTKSSLNESCNNNVDCVVANSECYEKTCQCVVTYYPVSSTCVLVSALQVTGLSQQTSTLNSVTVTWTEPADTSVVTGYTVTWTPASTTQTNSADVAKETATYNIPNLQSGTQYSVTVTTKISYRSQTTVSPATTGKTKSGLSDSCVSNTDCVVQNTDCYENKCQCMLGFYLLNSACSPISTLQVTGLSQQSSTLNSVTVTWTEPADTTSVVTGYTVTWTPASTTNTNSPDVPKGTATYNITSLQSGTLYSVTVTTKISYRSQTTVTPATTVKTKNSLDQECSQNSDCGTVNAECSVNESNNKVCRCKLGFYPKDSACSNISSLQVKGLSQQTSTLNSVTVTWTEPTDTTSVVTGYTVTWSSTTGTELGHFDVGKGTITYTIPNLQSASEFSVTVTTKISYRSQTTVSPATTVKTKKPLDQECFNSSECGTSNAECSENESKNKVCRCASGFYPKDSSCSDISSLQVTGLSEQSSTINSVTVNWTEPADTSVVTGYTVTWTPASTTNTNSADVTKGTTTYNITSLQSGTQYSVTVTTKISYRTQTTVSLPATVKTKPATPGPYMDSKSNKTAPDITLYFKSSAGSVTSYSVTLLGVGASNTYNSTQIIKPPSGQEYQQVIFTGITAGLYYTLQITAYSNGLSSEMYTSDPIRASLTPPGVVSNLTITDVTHSSMKTSWRKPAAPNGDITAYIINVISEDVCQQKIVFICNDCENMTDLEDPSCKNVNKSTIEMRKAELNNDSITFNYKIENLHPFTNYTVDVFSHNELDAGDHVQQIHETKTKAADTPTYFESFNKTSSSITLSWKPEPVRPGITNYNLTVFEKSETGDEYELMSSVDIKGWNEDSYVVTGLSSYWDYNFTLTASTSAGESSATSAGPIRTEQSAPKAVKTFTVTKIEDNYTAVTVNYECPKQKDGRNGEIQTSKLTYSSSEPGALTGDKDVPNNGSCRFSLTVDVTPEHNYTFSVKLKTISFGEVSVINFYTIAGPPLLKGKMVTISITLGSSESSFAMLVYPRSIYKPTTGKVLLAGLIVYRSDVKKAERRKREVKQMVHYEGYATWYDSEKDGFKTPYRATNESWINQNAPSMEYQIGVMKCDTQTKTPVFCNGPLPAGTKFVVVVFACTSQGCSESSGFDFETKQTETQIGLIVGIVIAVIVILALVVVIVFLIRRRRRKSPGGKYSPGPDVPLPEIDKTRPVTMADFKQHVETLHKDSKLLFSQEYEDLTSLSPNHPRLHSEMDGNRVKNRYVNILPFDHSRVKLLPLDEDPERDDSSDYINANYIPGYKGPREYIATQGPMTGTIADFWRMMWEQHSTLIVMLSDLQEKGKPKVDQYWPGNLYEPVNYGEITLELTSMSTMNKFTIRIFKMTLGKEERLVRQYFIPGWEDYSANLTPEDVINFIQTIRREIRPTSDCGPIVVHCSAGVGRSGTFIALDVFQQWVDEHGLDDELDVFEYVLKMRNNRQHMVQTEKQYIFIHDTLNVMIEKRKSILCPPDDNIYANKDMFDNKAFEPEEENLYQNVQQIKTPNTPTTVL